VPQAVSPARADGVVDTGTIVCDPCLSSVIGFGPIDTGSGVDALCTISGGVTSVGMGYGNWNIDT
jgi:hypothetical protein